jgi:tripartite-type tricarboxylate transporter receptor subunit TctC
MFVDLLNALPVIQEGKIRPIALTGSDRVEVFPDVPTLAELGLPGFNFDLQNWIFAPAKTPPQIVTSLNSKIRTAMNNDTRGKFAHQGVQLIDTPSPEELKIIFRQEISRWSKLVEDAGLARSQ